jgi:hypothetical protein
MRMAEDGMNAPPTKMPAIANQKTIATSRPLQVGRVVVGAHRQRPPALI